jgi:hypothetical protein
MAVPVEVRLQAMRTEALVVVEEPTLVIPVGRLAEVIPVVELLTMAKGIPAAVVALSTEGYPLWLSREFAVEMGWSKFPIPPYLIANSDVPIRWQTIIAPLLPTTMGLAHTILDVSILLRVILIPLQFITMDLALISSIATEHAEVPG